MVTVTGNKLEEIRDRLAFATSKLKLSNSVNLNSDNVKLERFFKQLLNARYGYNLVTTNFGVSNHPAIDLEDDERKICYQITSSHTSEKIKETIKTFKAKGFDKKYKELHFLFLVNDNPKEVRDRDKHSPIKINLFSHTVKSLWVEIDSLNDEEHISRIHQVVIDEMIYPSFNFLPRFDLDPEHEPYIPSIQRLIDAVNFNGDNEAIKALEVAMIALAKKLASLIPEQRFVIFKYLTLCHSKKNFYGYDMPGDVYMVTEDIDALFSKEERAMLNTLKRQNLLFEESNYRISHTEWEECESLYFSGGAEVNLFGWMKHVVKGNRTKLQEMFCSGIYKHLGL